MRLLHTLMRKITPLVLLLAALIVPSRATAEILRDTWFTTTIGGKRVGHMHELRERIREGHDDVIKTTLETRFVLSRMGTELSVRSEAVFIETPEGRPIRFISTNKLAKNEFQIHAKVEDGQFVVTQTALGRDTVTEIPADDDILFPYAIDTRIRQQVMTPGAQLVVRTFTPDSARPTKMTIDCLDTQEIELDQGRRQRLLRFETRQALVPGIVLTEWRDDEAAVLATALPLMGIVIRSVVTSRARALLDPEAVELLVNTLIETDQIIAHPRRVDRAVFEVTVPADADFEWPQDRRQRLVETREVVQVLEIRSEDWHKDKASSPPAKAYLAASSVLQVDDPRIRSLAGKAGGGGSDERIARRISRWVYTAIEKKSLSVGFATASEVAIDLTGDCTEHAVLATALSRARGIPARVAAGLVYLNGTFGYHMWTEVFVDGWHAIDPALGQEAIDATHIKLGVSALDQGFVDENLARIVQLIANLKIRLISYEVDGHSYQPGAAVDAGRIDAATYSNRVFGLRLKPPTGWKLVPRDATAKRGTLVRLMGPGDGGAELEATTIGYDFRIDQWVKSRLPDHTVIRETVIAVAEKPGRGYVMERDGVAFGLLAFLDRETLFTLHVDPLGQHGVAILRQFAAAFELDQK